MIYFITNYDKYETNDEIKRITIEKSLELLSPLKIIGLDTENTGLFPQIDKHLCLQLGNKEFQVIIDLTTVDIKYYKEYLEDPNRVFIVHNAQYDMLWLQYLGIVQINNVYCTFIAETIINQGKPFVRKSLKDCVERYCGVTLSKEERNLINTLGIYDSRILKYAAIDIQYLEEIREKQLEKLSEDSLLDINKVEQLFIPVLAYCVLSGMRIDVDKWGAKTRQDENIAQAYLQQLNNAVVNRPELRKFCLQPDLFNSSPTCGINWDSPAQVLPLFKHLNIPTQDKYGKHTVDSNIIGRSKNKDPIVSIYLKYKKYFKKVSTYGYNFLELAKVFNNNDYIHTSFKQIVDTGRLSSGGKIKGGAIGNKTLSLVNFQNIPGINEKERKQRPIQDRDCFIPGEGNVFVVSDYAN